MCVGEKVLDIINITNTGSFLCRFPIRILRVSEPKHRARDHTATCGQSGPTKSSESQPSALGHSWKYPPGGVLHPR